MPAMTTLAETASPASASALLDKWRQLLDEVWRQLRELAAHPARSVVLLPYAQLAPLAQRLWAGQFPDGFAPHFDTTHSWAARCGLFTPGPADLTLERGRDLLTARSLLEGAGLGDRHALLAGPLVDGAAQLAGLAAGVPPALRADWGEQARRALPADTQG